MVLFPENVTYDNFSLDTFGDVLVMYIIHIPLIVIYASHNFGDKIHCIKC